MGPKQVRRIRRLIWAYQVPTGWQTALPSDAASAVSAGGFVVIAPDGQATKVDLATGAVRTSAAVDAAAISHSGQGGTPGRLAVGVYGDQVVLVTTREGRPILAAYRLSTLGLQWTAALSTVDVFLSQCRPWLCATDQYGIHAFAPGTGAPGWTMTSVPRFRAWLNGWIYDEPDPTHPDAAALIDPLTQRVVLNLGRWRIPSPSATRPRAVDHCGQRTPRRSCPVYLKMADVERADVLLAT